MLAFNSDEYGLVGQEILRALIFTHMDVHLPTPGNRTYLSPVVGNCFFKSHLTDFDCQIKTENKL